MIDELKHEIAALEQKYASLLGEVQVTAGAINAMKYILEKLEAGTLGPTIAPVVEPK